MNFHEVKALTFDTGGTILDWHTGFVTALAESGKRHRIEKDWGRVANELRRRSLQKMLNLGEHEPPQYNFDDAHRVVLDELCVEHNLACFTDPERRSIWWDAVHNFAAIGLRAKKCLPWYFNFISDHFKLIIRTFKIRIRYDEL